MEGSSRGYQYGLILMLFLSLIFLPSISGHSWGLKEKRKIIGSMPPHCLNRCLGCRPCMAALVIHHSHLRSGLTNTIAMEDESYYLLSWKCRCKQKYFQP